MQRGDHSLFESGKLGVGHVAEPFRDRIGRKMHELEGPRRTSFHLMAFHRRYDLQKWTRSNRYLADERSVVSDDQ